MPGGLVVKNPSHNARGTVGSLSWERFHVALAG